MNLVIVFLTQIIFYYVLFNPTEVSTQEDLRMYPILIYVFAAVTVLITASGYLINDYFDYNSDIINEKIAKIPRFHNLIFYYSIVFIGFGMAWWMAACVGNLYLSLIYLGAVAVLYMYSSRWKREVLIGNVVVAGFTAGVPLILLVAEWDYLQLQDEAVANEIVAVLLIFGVFAFLINLIREIIKDIEDMHGDVVAGYETLPIVYGKGGARKVALGVSLVLLGLLVWTASFVKNNSLIIPFFIIIFLIIPQSYLSYSLLKSKDLNLTFLSKLCKMLMVIGPILIILLQLEA